jgi:predicted membrane protein
MPAMGKVFIILGVIFIVIGLAFMFGDKIPFLGKLPGDIYIKRERFSFYFPFTTSILISIVLMILFSIFRK